MDSVDEQQFCLRWNNFQANITSQFETLRDDEDFTDVTIACEGQHLKAHKVVLSACSPFFKDLFKNNPCSHPIIFMRDVEAKHIMALLEFMYAGEVNVAQAQLSNFLKTAESLRIRGLTDTGTDSYFKKEDDDRFLNEEESCLKSNQISSSTVVTSSQDIPDESLPKRQCTVEEVTVNHPFDLEPTEQLDLDKEGTLEPKIELPEYSSEEEGRDEQDMPGVELIQQLNQSRRESSQALRIRHRRLSDPHWSPIDDSSCFRKRSDGGRRNRLVKLGEGIEIYEDQLHSIKWNDYRKLTRGLATILFSPAELATCSVTGQRWSRAGSGERPVKPALDRAKVQAIISYVATRFPMIEISRIKQVLAYKCKENSTAFKMKAVRYYREQDK